MPFLLGYFGKNSDTFSKQIQKVATKNATAASLLVQQSNESIVCSGSYVDEEYYSDGPVTFQNSESLLVGKVFTKETYESVHTFNETQSAALSKNPALLFKKYWGRYAGVLHNPEEHSIALVRDPIGLSTIFYSHTGNGIIFATDIALIYDCLETKPSIDLQYFAEYITSTALALEATPFNGILELQPGMGLLYTTRGKPHLELLWDINGIKACHISNESEFEDTLLDTLKKSTQAWARGSKGVCVEFSGGTDSTAVMILLKEVLQKDQNCIAVNYMDSHEPSSNEIKHAQEVADLCDIPLYFVDTYGIPLFENQEGTRRGNRPSSLLLFPKMIKELYQLSKTHGCTDIMNGQGGDHVFIAPINQNSLADFWRAGRFKGSSALLKEIASCYRMPFTSVLWKNIKAYAGFPIEYTEELTFFTPEFAKKYMASKFYLDGKLKMFAPGKADHIKSLSHGVDFADRNLRVPQTIFTHPLLSQPVVELALQIPTYQTFSDGFDRIFFRKSVSKLKKPNALWRRQKGSTTATMLKAINAKHQTIVDMVSNGYLVKAGVIDKKWFDTVMLKMKHGTLDNLWPIIKLITMETWFQQWNIRS